MTSNVAPTCSVPPSVNFFSANTAMNLTYTITAQANTPAGPYYRNHHG